MTHNIIHDEEKIKELCASIAFENYCVEYIMQQYAEHYLIKHIDSEIERLEKETAKDRKKKLGLPTEMNGFIQMGTIAGKAKSITDQITHLRELKAQLTKSK